MTPPDIPAALAEWLIGYALDESYEPADGGGLTYERAARLHAAIEKGRKAEDVYRGELAAWDAGGEAGNYDVLYPRAKDADDAFWTALLAELREGK